MDKQRNGKQNNQRPAWATLGIVAVLIVLWLLKPAGGTAVPAGATAAPATATAQPEATVGEALPQSQEGQDNQEGQESRPEATQVPYKESGELTAEGLYFDEADPRSAKEYTDAELLYWNAGTFDTKQDSLAYHFSKHGEELPADTVAAYLNQAYETRAQVLESTDGWRITQSSGANAAHKYKNQADSRFIIMDDGDDSIYSFGR